MVIEPGDSAITEPPRWAAPDPVAEILPTVRSRLPPAPVPDASKTSPPEPAPDTVAPEALISDALSEPREPRPTLPAEETVLEVLISPEMETDRP